MAAQVYILRFLWWHTRRRKDPDSWQFQEQGLLKTVLKWRGRGEGDLYAEEWRRILDSLSEHSGAVILHLVQTGDTCLTAGACNEATWEQ